MSAARCSLCGTREPALLRLGALGVCGTCVTRDVTRRVAGWGCQAQVTRGGEGPWWMRFRGRAPGVAPLSASIRLPRGALMRLLSRPPGRRIRTGDPIFDAEVEVWAEEPEELQALLTDDGLREALTDLVALAGDLELIAGGLQFEAEDQEEPVDGRVAVVAVAVLRHLQRVCGGPPGLGIPGLGAPP